MSLKTKKQKCTLCKICDNCQFEIDCKTVERIADERLNEYLERSI